MEEPYLCGSESLKFQDESTAFRSQTRNRNPKSKIQSRKLQLPQKQAEGNENPIAIVIVNAVGWVIGMQKNPRRKKSIDREERE